MTFVKLSSTWLPHRSCPKTQFFCFFSCFPPQLTGDTGVSLAGAIQGGAGFTSKDNVQLRVIPSCKYIETYWNIDDFMPTVALGLLLQLPIFQLPTAPCAAAQLLQFAAVPTASCQVHSWAPVLDGHLKKHTQKLHDRLIVRLITWHREAHRANILCWCCDESVEVISHRVSDVKKRVCSTSVCWYQDKAVVKAVWQSCRFPFFP